MSEVTQGTERPMTPKRQALILLDKVESQHGPIPHKMSLTLEVLITEEIATLQTELSRLKAEREWRPIEGAELIEEQEYDVWMPDMGGRWTDCMWDAEKGYFYHSATDFRLGIDTSDKPTHYRLPPSPPSQPHEEAVCSKTEPTGCGYCGLALSLCQCEVSDTKQGEG